MQQQQEDPTIRYKRAFNNTFGLCIIYQRAIVILLRDRFGVEALGTPCFFALILLLAWSGFSGDTLMWWYTGIWFLFFMHRRVQSLRLQNQIHSRDDGWPLEAMRICKDVFGAKQYVEPIGVCLAGAIAKWFYHQQGWNPNGLPHFLLCGAVIMAFVEMGEQAAWKRRIRGMRDAQWENEQMIRDFHDQYQR